MLASFRPASPKSLTNLAVPALAYVVALVAAETVTRTVSPLVGAVCYAVGFIVLVNLAILANVRKGEGSSWRLLIVAAVPFLDRLLVLSMPPFRSGSVEASALWGLPLLAAALAFGRPPLMSAAASHRPQVASLEDTNLSGRATLVRVYLLGVAAPLAALGLGVIAVLWGDLGNRPSTPPPVLAAIVVACCVQEWLYRRVVQPVAVGVAGDRVGVLATSWLVAFTSIATLAALDQLRLGLVVPATAAALLFGVTTAHGRSLVNAVVGRGLFTVAVVGLTTRQSSPPDGIGLIGHVSPLLLAAFVVVIGVAIVELLRPHPRAWVLALLTTIFLLLAYGLEAVLVGSGNVQPAWLQAQFGDPAALTSESGHYLDPRFAWPAFFSLTTFWAESAGLDSVVPVLRWVPLGLAAVATTAMHALARSALRNGPFSSVSAKRVSWLATWIFIVVNWAEETYFSPEAVSYVLLIGALAVIMSILVHPGPVAGRVMVGQRGVPSAAPWKRRLASAFVMLLAIVMSFTDQLSPYALVAALVALLLWGRLSTPWLPALVLVPPIVWLALGGMEAWADHLILARNAIAEVSSSIGGAVIHPLIGGAGPSDDVGAGWRIVVAVFIVVSAAVGFATLHRRGTRTWLLAGLAISALALAAVQPFNVETLSRCYLFALPWLAIASATSLDALLARRSSAAYDQPHAAQAPADPAPDPAALVRPS